MAERGLARQRRSERQEKQRGSQGCQLLPARLPRRQVRAREGERGRQGRPDKPTTRPEKKQLSHRKLTAKKCTFVLYVRRFLQAPPPPPTLTEAPFPSAGWEREQTRPVAPPAAQREGRAPSPQPEETARPAQKPPRSGRFEGVVPQLHTEL